MMRPSRHEGAEMDVEAAVRAIREDRARGASELARAAVEAVALAAQCAPPNPEALSHAVRDAARALVLCRPSMAPIVNAVADCLSRLPDPAAPTVKAVESAVRETEQALAAAQAALVARTAEAVAGARRVVTLSYSSTVASALAAAAVEEIVVGEGRPGCEGRRLAERLTAPDSVDSGQPDRSAQRPDRRVVFVTDAQLGLHLDGAAVVLVGADSLLPDGSTINKAGTLLLAATATALGVPVLVAADRFKLAAWWRPGDPVDLDAMPAAEVWAEAPPGIVVRNVYFDRAPARFISGIITERGRLDPADLEAVADRLATRFGEVYGWRRGASA